MRSTRPVVCPACEATTAMRVNRNGFMQRRVLGIFGYYPWKCGACGTVFLYKRRGIRHQSSQDAGSAEHKHGEA